MDEGQDPAVLETIAALGRQGRGRCEIAAAMGLSLNELEAREAGEPVFAQAMARAEAAARAWWAGLARDALEEGPRFSAAAWRAAASSCLDDGALAWARGGKGAGAAGPPGRPRVLFDIPDNGGRRPDGRYLTHDELQDLADAEGGRGEDGRDDSHDDEEEA